MGHARDYVIAMWKILQLKQPDDFVIATGKQYSIRQFIVLFQETYENIWKGKGLKKKVMTL